MMSVRGRRVKVTEDIWQKGKRGRKGEEGAREE